MNSQNIKFKAGISLGGEFVNPLLVQAAQDPELNATMRGVLNLWWSLYPRFWAKNQQTLKNFPVSWGERLASSHPPTTTSRVATNTSTTTTRTTRGRFGIRGLSSPGRSHTRASFSFAQPPPPCYGDFSLLSLQHYYPQSYT